MKKTNKADGELVPIPTLDELIEYIKASPYLSEETKKELVASLEKIKNIED
jgi:hypothetical protein